MSDLELVDPRLDRRWYCEKLPQGGYALYLDHDHEYGLRLICDPNDHPIIMPSTRAMFEWCKRKDEGARQLRARQARQREDCQKVAKIIRELPAPPTGGNAAALSTAPGRFGGTEPAIRRIESEAGMGVTEDSKALQYAVTRLCDALTTFEGALRDMEQILKESSLPGVLTGKRTDEEDE